MRYAVASSIDGSGRTTLTLNLGLALCDRGISVLMIDVDPQGCLGHLLARRDDEWAGLARNERSDGLAWANMSSSSAARSSSAVPGSATRPLSSTTRKARGPTLP